MQEDNEEPSIELGLSAVVSEISKYSDDEDKTRILLAVAALYDLPICRDGENEEEEEE